jgi:uncharacterized membrane protein YoaT (DUF817 family)
MQSHQNRARCLTVTGLFISGSDKVFQNAGTERSILNRALTVTSATGETAYIDNNRILLANNLKRVKQIVHEFWLFGLKQAWACLFAGTLLFFILLTQFWYPFSSIARYDFLFIVAVVTQLLLLALRLETLREAAVIVVFHLVATGMELFKTSPGIASWHYPGDAVLAIGNVPLFAGFMYSAVGSYIARVWRIFEFRFTCYPPLWSTALLALLIYLNFFSHHYFYDIRWWLVGASLAIFGRVWIMFRIDAHYRRMPLVLGFSLVAFFIWIAENLATYAKVWIYPSQNGVWSMVSWQKIVAWYLLMLISFVLVSLVNRPHRHSATLPSQQILDIA